jgi:hypothetical protein
MKLGVVTNAATALLCIAHISSGHPIALPVGDVAVLNYSGYESLRHNECRDLYEAVSHVSRHRFSNVRKSVFAFRRHPHGEWPG